MPFNEVHSALYLSPPLISLASLDSFPPGEAKGNVSPKFSPQGLWNVERGAVDKMFLRRGSNFPVEKL